MRQGYGAKAAIRQAIRQVDANGDHFGAMVMDICGPSASAALRRDEGVPTYTGGNTTISEDPFEF